MAAIKEMAQCPENFGSFAALFYVDPGINKPFDRIAKEFAEEAPEVFLHLLGLAGSGAVLEPLRPETAPPVVMPDYVASLSSPGQETRTLHVEFFVRYRDEIPSIIARYGGSLAWQYRRPVLSVLLLLRNDGAPDKIPGAGECVIGETRITHPFRTLRLWEMDPEPLLTAQDPGWRPWALLMNASPEQAETLGAEIAASRNEEWIARFLLLGSVRYDRTELEEMLGRGGHRMGLMEAIVEGSSIFREQRDLAKAEGKEEGKEEGRSSEAARLLRLTLSSRFPGLERMPELDGIVSVADLESLLIDHAIRSHDRESVERAIRAAAAQAN
jgi:hypothetical protein